MIGYVVLGTNDLARAASFYDELLAEMGVTRMMDLGERGYAWAAAMDKPMLCIMTPFDGKPATVGNGVMAGIAADSHDQVDRIYKKAIELGATDEGPPGLRAEEPSLVIGTHQNAVQTNSLEPRMGILVNDCMYDWRH